MRLIFRLKHHFFSAFRELFVHHHGSLEFRAKICALLIAADENATVESYIAVKEIGREIYPHDEERINLLMLTTKEKVKKVRENNGLDIDTLIANVQQDLKFVPRYAKKIDTNQLRKLLAFTHDDDTRSYQENILEFLEQLKYETLTKKEEQIALDEQSMLSKTLV